MPFNCPPKLNSSASRHIVALKGPVAYYAALAGVIPVLIDVRRGFGSDSTARRTLKERTAVL